MNDKQERMYKWLAEAEDYEVNYIALDIYFSTHKTINEEIENYLKQKVPVIREIFDMYFGINQPQEKVYQRISEKVNRSPARVRQIIQAMKNYFPHFLIKSGDEDFIKLRNKLFKMKKIAKNELNNNHL